VIAVNRTNNKLLFAGAAAGSEAIARTAAVAHATIVDQHLTDTARATARRGSLVNRLACDQNTCWVQSDPAGAGYAVALNPTQ
jgi:hypothetical protein